MLGLSRHVVAPLALLGFLLVPAAADAATYSRQSTGATTLLTVNGTVGADVFNLSTSGGTLTVNVGTGGWTAGSGCTASGNTLSCSNADPGTIVVINGSDGSDTIGAEPVAAGYSVRVFAGPGNDSFTGGAGADEGSGQAGRDTLKGNGGNDRLFGDFEGANDNATNPDVGDDALFGDGGDDDLFGGPGDDVASGGNNNDEIFLGAGRDEAAGDAGDDSIRGEDSSDVLSGGAGVDDLDGGANRDTLTPGLGSDTVKGGSGFDVVSYAERRPDAGGAHGVTVTLDSQKNDGEPGEQDLVDNSVEDITGGAGPDTLIGNVSSNTLVGGGGNDKLSSDGAIEEMRPDVFVAGSGDDTINSRNGKRESIDCGSGTDAVSGDDIDQASADCENPDLSGDLVPDEDGDGFRKPGDCGDKNAAQYPGAPEIPDNGIDEDCNGADATNPDRDGDGSPRPADCDDTNKDIKPTATEVRGNAIDEDCDHVANPYPRITSSITVILAVFRTHSEATHPQAVVQVQSIPSGARVRLKCRGRGCPRKGFSRTYKRGKKTLNLKKALRGRLKPGARVTITVTKRGFISKSVRTTVKKRALPASITLCREPGAKKAEEC